VTSSKSDWGVHHRSLFRPRQHLEATLHQLSLHTIYNHRCGFFSQFEALWNCKAIADTRRTYREITSGSSMRLPATASRAAELRCVLVCST